MTSIPLCALQLDIGHIPTRPLMEYRVYRLMVKRSLQNSNGAYALNGGYEGLGERRRLQFSCVNLEFETGE